MSRSGTFLLACVLALVSACTKSEVTVKFHVNVKTNQGEPVAGAVVKLDGREIGVTDSAGRLEAEVASAPESRQRVEIAKTSDTYYFAPFSQTFVVGDASEQDVPIAAVMYFIPKPSDEPATPASAETPAPEATATPTATPTSVAAKVDAKVAPSPTPTATAPATAKPTVTPRVTLNKVDESSEPPPEAPTTPKSVPVTSFTVHVYSGKNPVNGVEVSYGEGAEGTMISGCTSNERGRCVITFKTRPEAPITFVARKTGYRAEPMTAKVIHEGRLRIDMVKGEVLEIQAMLQQFNQQRGLSGVEVMIKGASVGTTDSFGRLSHSYVGKRNDLVDVTLTTQNFLPDTFSTDFVVGGPMSLVRYFVPRQPPVPRVALLKAVPAGSVSDAQSALFNTVLDEDLVDAVKRHLFGSGGFKETSADGLLRNAGAKGITTTLRKGWQTTSKSAVDAVLVPTVVFAGEGAKGRAGSLELSLVDARGQVLAAGQEKIEGGFTRASVDRAVAALTARLLRGFPYEGAVLQSSGGNVSTNLGSNVAGGLKAGDEMEVYGIQSNISGSRQAHRRIAVLRVASVSDRGSECSVKSTEPRSAISRGDLVVARPRRAPEVPVAERSTVRVVGVSRTGELQPIPQANVYFNDRWAGATDDEGRLYVSSPDIKGAGTIKVVRQGYAEYVAETTLGKGRSVEVRLSRELAFLRIASNPSGAAVRVDGKTVGKTPLTSPIPVPSGFIKLEVEGPDGYKLFSQVLELDLGTLDLTGPNTVNLERDLRAVAKSLLAAGKVRQALAQLESIPSSHTDYLLACHEAGEIYLTMLADPARAAASFGKVTSNPAVRGFMDKRFIGSHINEGIALFLTGEKLMAADPATARAHYAKVAEVLEAVRPQLRFVPRDQYAHSVHNVDYHLALARHRLWQISKDVGALSQAVAAWRSYLDGSARSVAAEGDTKSLVESAQVYYKQASAAMASAAESGSDQR